MASVSRPARTIGSSSTTPRAIPTHRKAAPVAIALDHEDRLWTIAQAHQKRQKRYQAHQYEGGKCRQGGAQRAGRIESQSVLLGEHRIDPAAAVGRDHSDDFVEHAPFESFGGKDLPHFLAFSFGNLLDVHFLDTSGARSTTWRSVLVLR